MRIAAGLLVAVLLGGSAAAQPRTPGQLLHARFPEVAFTEAPLSEVLDFVGQMAGTSRRGGRPRPCTRRRGD